MAVIPYNLKADYANSDMFYSILEKVTDELYQKAISVFGGYIKDFEDFIVTRKIEEKRFTQEYLIELVLIGTLWNRYISNAINSKFLITQFSSALSELRLQKPELKPEIDKMKASLLNNYLLKHSDEEANIDLINFKLLIDWLSSSGDFREEVIRLENWDNYFTSIEPIKVQEILNQAIDYSDTFASFAYEHLHPFTIGLFDFYDSSCIENIEREDIILREKTEEEYHLNMICSQILNNAYLDEFKTTKEKVILLPTCMNNELGDCKAESDGTHNYCTGCDKNCHIGQIKHSINGKAKIALIPHSFGFSQFLQKWKGSDEVGLIGVACVLNLLTGGYEMRKLNIKSQYVFLDYCGCRKHWDSEGVATNINLNQLKKVLEAN